MPALECPEATSSVHKRPAGKTRAAKKPAAKKRAGVSVDGGPIGPKERKLLYSKTYHRSIVEQGFSGGVKVPEKVKSHARAAAQNAVKKVGSLLEKAIKRPAAEAASEASASKEPAD